MTAASSDTRRPAPKQARSQARRRRILDAALEIIAKRGSDLMRLSDVAERAEVPIGSIYQFFSDKSEVIQTLFAEQLEGVNTSLREGFSMIDSLDTAIHMSNALIELYYQKFKSNPALRDIAAGMQADKHLKNINMMDTRQNAQAIFDSIQAFIPPDQHDRLRASSVIIATTTGHIAILANDVGEEEGRAVIEHYKGMIVREISSFKS